jgi:hypothetical protein
VHILHHLGAFSAPTGANFAHQQHHNSLILTNAVRQVNKTPFLLPVFIYKTTVPADFLCK